jgi:hypothetical protein
VLRPSPSLKSFAYLKYRLEASRSQLNSSSFHFFQHFKAGAEVDGIGMTSQKGQVGSVLVEIEP